MESMVLLIVLTAAAFEKFKKKMLALSAFLFVFYEINTFALTFVKTKELVNFASLFHYFKVKK